MAERYKVYILTCKANGKKYIGMTKRRLSARWSRGEGYAKQEEIYADIQKYGWDGFEKESIIDGVDQLEAAKIERELVEKHDTTNPQKGYNKTLGGEILGGHYWLESTLQERSESKKGNKNPNYGRKGTFSGRKHTDEAKKKISESSKRRCESQKYREKQLHQLEEARRNIKWTKEKRERQRKSAKECMSKKCVCITTGETFTSATEAAKKYGTTSSNIARACRGERTHALGMEFKYLEG